MLPSLKGYGTQAVVFSGEAQDYELWSIKFKGLIRLHNLHAELDGTTNDAEKNAKIFAYLVQCLDDNSINLIIRDCENLGREAFKLLTDHYMGGTKPRIISLYTELTALNKRDNESITEYLLRAETAAARLKQAEEVISEKLLIAMLLKGLPDNFLPFATIINNTEDITFAKFKTQLRNFEENEAARNNHSTGNDEVRKLTCRKCGTPGHLANTCRKASNTSHPSSSSSKPPSYRSGQSSHSHNRATKSQWCSHCKKSNHTDQTCWTKKRNKAYNLSNEDEVIFRVNVLEGESLYQLSDNKNNYLIDCGATTHILCDESKLFHKDPNFNPNSHTIELADNSRQTGVATARGNAQISLIDNKGISRQVTLKNVLCIPSYKQNILSVHSMTQNGLKVTFTDQNSFISTKNNIIFPITKSGRLYFVKSITNENKSKKIEKSLEEWHYTLGHCNIADIIHLESISDDMKITNRKKFECNFCIEAKMTNKMNRTPDAKASKPLEMVHTDLCGPISPETIQGARYAIVFVDDYSGLIKVYFIKHKSSAAKATAKYLSDMSPYGEVKIIRSDGGGEFISKEYENLLIENKIQHQFSSPNSPHQNGTAERAWRTLMEAARALIYQSGLPKDLWSYAVRHAAFTRNRCYSQTHNNTPYAKFMGKSPHIKNLRIFGTDCHAQIQKPKKLDKRSQQGKYIGQDPESPAHLVYINKQKGVIKVRNVIFSNKIPNFQYSPVIQTLDVANNSPITEEEASISTIGGPVTGQGTSNSPGEGSTTGRGPTTTPDGGPAVGLGTTSSPGAGGGLSTGGAAVMTPPLAVVCDGTATAIGEPKRASEPVEQNSEVEFLPYNSGGHNFSNNNENISTRPKRNVKPPGYLSEYETDFHSDESFHDAENENSKLHYIDYFCKISNVPVTFNDAIKSNDADHWQKAMNEEYNSLVEMKTFELVPRPSKKVIGGRWVYVIKNDQSKNPIFKARYVAKGFNQSPSIDYEEIFSPTARLTSIRVLCQLAVQENLEIYQLDVKTAYLNADIDHEIYLEQPKGFEVIGNNGMKLVMKLNKSIYGLKQAGRMWNQLLHNFLLTKQFTQANSDHCVYTRNFNGKITILIVWVDDIIIATSSNFDANEIKTALAERFRMKDFGIISNFLGIDFEVGNNTIKVHQSKYVQKMLDRFNMTECNTKSIPCDLSTVKIEFNNDSQYLDDPRIFREIVGSLIYLMTCSRPDICYVVSILSQFMSKPTVAHLNLAKFVLRYLKGTMDYGLIYTSCEKLDIIGYTDASWANTIDRKSISGYCFQMSKVGALVSWKSKKQQVVALSTCESEYIGASFALQEGVFLQQLTHDMGIFPNFQPINLFVDNLGSIQLAKNPVFHQRSKHIETKYHYIRSKVNAGSVNLIYVPSKENLADIFTKPCTKQSLVKFAVCKPA